MTVFFRAAAPLSVQGVGAIAPAEMVGGLRVVADFIYQASRHAHCAFFVELEDVAGLEAWARLGVGELFVVKLDASLLDQAPGVAARFRDLVAEFVAGDDE